MREHQQEFEAKGATLAAIGLGDRNYARLFRDESHIDFPLLIDEKRVAYQAAHLKSANLLHIAKGENFRRRKEAKANGFAQQKLGKDPFQLGASFVFAPGDRDLFAHLSETFSDNAPVASLLQALG